ncbi:type II secretion system protein N [Sandarakinorhabdus oryzae]|uniref:type II secretion system protein N n=1 Tax=Sandarakinorhabdus oryzae TaxID=2675220 RepID=UPI0012E14014|nr:type II secretion system protein N [Sandarakinorhabdus oryzae]
MPWPARLIGAAEWAGWVLAGLVTARLIWLALTPAGPLGQPVFRQASGPVLVAIDPFSPAGPATADTVSGLDLVLLGTRVDAASGRGSAIIATADGLQKSVGVGEEIMPGVRLAAVEFESVTLDRGGAREQLYIDQSGGPAEAQPPWRDPK